MSKRPKSQTPLLSNGAWRALELMRAAELEGDFEGAEIVCDGAACFIGLDTVAKPKVYELLRLVLISDASDGGGQLERYDLNEEGRALLANPGYVPKICEHL